MKLTIYSPEKTIYDGDVDLVELPGTKGRFEVLNNHDALISTLQTGNIRYVAGDETFLQPVRSGYVEVNRNVISVCVQL